MRARIALVAILVSIAPGATPAPAEDVTGADRLLCAAVEASVCALDAECYVGAPWNWDIPDFIEVDLVARTLSTTKASPRPRTTPIKHLDRSEGLIVIQGVEAGRAFSFVITEETGMLSAAVARQGITVGVFGSCTPMAAAR